MLTPYRANIGSQLTGVVDQVPVEEGQTVRRGQPLIVLESSEQAAAVSQAAILANEPTGNLDTVSANEVFDLLRALNQSHATAILMVTHNEHLAGRCDYIRHVVDGRIV